METDTRAREQALAQLASITKMVKDVTSLDDEKREIAREAIEQDALDIAVRSNWASTKDQWEPEQYKIILSIGGPATRIKGTLFDDGSPETAQLEYKDWGTPWTRLTYMRSEDIDALLAYAGCFYFGD